MTGCCPCCLSQRAAKGVRASIVVATTPARRQNSIGSAESGQSKLQETQIYLAKPRNPFPRLESARQKTPPALQTASPPTNEDIPRLHNRPAASMAEQTPHAQRLCERAHHWRTDAPSAPPCRLKASQPKSKSALAPAGLRHDKEQWLSEIPRDRPDAASHKPFPLVPTGC